MRELQGDTIVRKGEFGDSFFLVQKGIVAIKLGQQYKQLGIGECFGERAFLKRAQQRTATVQVGFLGDATSSLGDTKSSGWLRRRKGSAYFLLEHVVHPLDGARRQVVDVRERSTVVGRRRLSDHHLSLGFHLGDVLGRGGVDHVHTHQRILHRQCSMVLRRPTRCRCLSETHPLV